jgi:DNA-binding MarR family transcriptional regulator
MNHLDDDVGFLLAKATQRWNELLLERFRAAGFPEVRASYGSVLLPLFEQDGLRIGEIGRRARLSKPSMTALVSQCAEAGLVQRERDPADGRAFRIVLTARGLRFRAIAQDVLRELDALAAGRLGPEDRDALVRGLKGVMDL